MAPKNKIAPGETQELIEKTEDQLDVQGIDSEIEGSGETQESQSPEPKPEEQKSPASYVAKVKILKKDKSIIEIGSDVSRYPPDKLAKWLDRGMIEAKK